MSTRSEKERVKQIQDKCQNLLAQMLRDEDNKYCVDCDAKGPRWASWNLGIFLCIRCAGIHRNLGVHISRVKSVNLDSWTPEQVVSLQQMGNSRARAVYEANLPDSFRRPQTDCSLESFIRAKYEHKKYIAREWVPPTLPKVNWDKELDEEAERQRRRKKDSQKTALNQAPTIVKKPPEVVPQLPKPKCPANPKSNRSSEPAVQDFLGLDIPDPQTATNGQSGDDIFTTFLSAPPVGGNDTSPENSNTNNDVGKFEEESFFNQTMPGVQEKSKMSKDSILALYGTSNQTMFPNNTGAFNQQLLSQQFPQTLPGLGAFNVTTNNSYQQPINMPVGQISMAPNQMVPSQFGNQVGNTLVNSATTNSQMMIPAQGNTTNVPQTMMNSNNGWSGSLTQTLQPAPGSNPFLNLNASPQLNPNFNQIPQQFSQMSLGAINFPSTTLKPTTTSLTGQSLSTNLWQ